jgi:hypothetical protein
MDLNLAVRRVVLAYPAGSPQLVKALVALIETQAETMAKESEKDLARRKCLKKHVVGGDSVCCLECAKKGAYREERVVGDPLA